MNLSTLNTLITVVTGSLLIVMYLATMWRNYLGSNFKSIYFITGILLLSNRAALAFYNSYYKLFYKNDIKPSSVWVLSLAYAV